MVPAAGFLAIPHALRQPRLHGNVPTRFGGAFVAAFGIVDELHVRFDVRSSCPYIAFIEIGLLKSLPEMLAEAFFSFAVDDLHERLDVVLF